jgi:hypothetical protein
MGLLTARRLTLSFAFMLLLGFAAAACSNSTSPEAPTTTTPTIASFTGSWASTSLAATGNVCSAMTWTITSSSDTAVTINYRATCAGEPVTGTGTGTLNGSTLNWTTTGTAANTCSFAMTGTAIPNTSGDLNLTYGGTVCGIPVAGSDVLHH